MDYIYRYILLLIFSISCVFSVNHFYLYVFLYLFGGGVVAVLQELEQELTEQRGLTQAIARQGSRAQLHSQDSEDHGQPSSR